MNLFDRQTVCVTYEAAAAWTAALISLAGASRAELLPRLPTLIKSVNEADTLFASEFCPAKFAECPPELQEAAQALRASIDAVKQALLEKTSGDEPGDDLTGGQNG